MEIVSGKIVDIKPGHLVIDVPYTNTARLCRRQYDEVTIGLEDGRHITPEQRRKAYALMGEIAEFTGDTPDSVKQDMKHDFLRDRVNGLAKEVFSLSSVDVTTAKEFISYLIDLILRYDMPVHVPLYTLCDDVRRYVHACLMHEKCAVCGVSGADLHHVDRIGMGYDRRDKPQMGNEVYSLCRAHHQESHSIGEKAFSEKYHLEPVEIDQEISKAYGLTKKARRTSK